MPIALKNLEQEVDYIAQDNPDAALSVATRIWSSVKNLSENPSLGKAGRVPGTRELIVGGTPYIIPYRVREETVEILRVFHSSRKWQG